MAKTERITTLVLHKRGDTGTTNANATRRSGQIPGVLYGHGGSEAVSVDARALADLVAGGGASHIVDADIDGTHDSVLLREVQRDPITRRAIHADFQRVSKGEAIYAAISIVTVGVSIGVKDAGAVMDVVTHAVEVKGPADKIPDNFEVDVSHLNVGEHVSAADLKLPAGFTLVTPHDTVIVSVEQSRTARDAEEAAPAAPEPAADAAAPAPAAGA